MTQTTLSAGDLALYRTVTRGFVKIKILEIHAPSPALMRDLMEVTWKVTADRGAYKRGEVITSSTSFVYTRSLKVPRFIPDSQVEPTWKVQVGRGTGAYSTRYFFKHEKAAALYYSSINIGNGYKKRLLDPEGKTVARQFS